MSKEQILFLFAVLGAVGGVIKILEYFGVKPPFIKTRVDTSGGQPRQSTPNSKTLFWAVALSLISLVLSTIGFYQAIPNQTTVDNVETNLRGWLYKHQMFVDPKPDDKHYFVWDVTIPGPETKVFRVSRSKEDNGRTLLLLASVTQGPTDKPLLDKLSARQTLMLVSRIKIELARQNAAVNEIFKPFTVAIVITVPITKELDEYHFFQKVTEIDSLAVLLRETFRLFMVEQGIE